MATLTKKRKTREIKLNLPWPPSVNHLYRVNPMGGKSRLYKVKKAVAYADAVAWQLKQEKTEGFGTGRVEIDSKAHPPDRRRRDLDNIQKAILDSLQGAGVYEDDCQVDRIGIQRCQVVPDGMVSVTVSGVDIVE